MLPIWSWQDHLTERRASMIINQLEAYHKRQGHYPDSLAQLVPQYLPKVPATAKGLVRPLPFQYSTGEYKASIHPTGREDEFALGYHIGMMVDATYNSSTHQWVFHE
ncbi:MAG TPA: hypothetical protein VF598_11995 [Hymenobacter sp.]